MFSFEKTKVGRNKKEEPEIGVLCFIVEKFVMAKCLKGIHFTLSPLIF